MTANFDRPLQGVCGRAAGLLAAGLAAALAGGAAQAEGNGLRFSGFATAGVVNTSGDAAPWGFRRDVTQMATGDRRTRADVDSRLGLQLNWQPTPQWEAVVQAVAKRRASTAHTEESLAWAFVAWRPSSNWSLRVGRTGADLFLLADYRDVGFAYPWVRPSVEFYGWMPIWAVDGADLTYADTTAGVHWRAKLFGGRYAITLAGDPDYGDTHVRGRSVAGGTFTAEHEGLTLKLTLAQARSEGDDPGALQRLRDGLIAVRSLPVPSVAGEAQALLDTLPDGAFVNRYAAVGVTWERGPWTLQAEVARVGGNFDLGQRDYAYASAAYRWQAMTFYTMAAGVRSRKPPVPWPQWQATLTPLIGPELAAQAQMLADTPARAYNYPRQDQRTWSLGMRWDLTAQTALKLQWDRVSVRPYGAGLWTSPGLDARRARVLAASLDMVF